MFFFFNDTATTEIYTLSLHDALPILRRASTPPLETTTRRPARPWSSPRRRRRRPRGSPPEARGTRGRDRKSTRLNSSHANISYAVFCLKKKNINKYLASYTSSTHMFL